MIWTLMKKLMKKNKVEARENMNQTVENFIVALNRVKEIDYKTTKVELIVNQINEFGDEFSTYENNFVTKLNEHYAVLTHTNDIQEPHELIRQFQIPKKYVYSDIEDIEIISSVKKIKRLFKEDHEMTELLLIPDFIIHKDETDKEFKNQRLIAEIKTEQNLNLSKFVWDFLKLNIYIEKFNFQTGIFLGVNFSSDSLQEYVDYYVKNKLFVTKRTDDLYFIVKENYSSKEKVTPLTSIIYLNGIKYS